MESNAWIRRDHFWRDRLCGRTIAHMTSIECYVRFKDAFAAKPDAQPTLSGLEAIGLNSVADVAGTTALTSLGIHHRLCRETRHEKVKWDTWTAWTRG